MAEGALGFASTQGEHDPLTEHPSEEDDDPRRRLAHGGKQPWDARRRAHDDSMVLPPPVAGNGHSGAAFGLGEYFKAFYGQR